ncbi:MAG: hypothetical protein AB7V26_06625 [Lysobacterales bacterium]
MATQVIANAIRLFDSSSILLLLLSALSMIIFERVSIGLLAKHASVRKIILINLWQVGGVFLTGMWLLRVASHWSEYLVCVVMIVYFGMYKPFTLK